MPANKKYLTTSISQRFAKISAAIPGAFLIAATLHMAAAQWFGDYKIAVATFSFLVFPVWIIFMILPFLFHNGWKCWMLYIMITGVFLSLIFLGKSFHPVTV